MKVFTMDELAQFDGSSGRPAYVAYRGLVYDVTDSFLWKDGKHQGLHRAGRNLSADLAQAPHEADFLERFPVVGQLREEPTRPVDRSRE